MIAFASLAVAVALAQAPPSPDAPAPPAAEQRESVATPRVVPEPSVPLPATSSSTPESAAPPSAPAKTRPAPKSAATPPKVRPATPSTPSPSPATPRPSDRAEAARTALAFLDALVAYDANRLAAASAERFSFDGDVQTGRDAVRRTWRELLDRRGHSPARLLDLELLPASDALARLGAPPARVAPLAAGATWVAIANVSGRAVVLFLAREAGRFTVSGIHD